MFNNENSDNPDNVYRNPTVRDRSRVIYDCVYLWPQFTTITKPVQEELMIFTASKFTGHAGSRVGWALVKNPVIAQRMRAHLLRETIGLNIESQVCRDSDSCAFIQSLFGLLIQIFLRLCSMYFLVLQIRLTTIFDYIADGYSSHGISQYVRYAVEAMKHNWDMLIRAFEQAPEGFRLLNSSAKGAYAWICCPEGYHCARLFEDVGLISSPGSGFFVEEHFTRFQMMMRTVEMESLVKKVLQRFHEMDLPEKHRHAQYLNELPCHEEEDCLHRHLP